VIPLEPCKHILQPLFQEREVVFAEILAASCFGTTTA